MAQSWDTIFQSTPNEDAESRFDEFEHVPWNDFLVDEGEASRCIDGNDLEKHLS